MAVLLEREGATVTRDELCQRVWGKETHVDFDQGLNYCIAQIRTALGDSAEVSQFVRTVPKRGYQFIAPIIPIGALDTPLQPPPRIQRRLPRWTAAAALLLITGGFVVTVVSSRRVPIRIAVARFDNETGLSEMNAFSDALTDMVVAQLTAESGSRFGIIGNAAVLRKPRAERDLKALESTLQAGYVVLGQVQGSPERIRVLAHLIRLPDQTHVGVVRLDHNISDPLQTETEFSRVIAADFLRHLSASHRSLTN